MKVVFFTNFYYPHIGGVEKHVEKVGGQLIKKGYKLQIVTSKHESKLKSKEFYKGVKIHRINYPKVKYIGLLSVWLWLLKNISLIKESDIVHIHDVFIWYLPFRFLFPRKKVFITHHGGQAIYPVSKKEIFMKQLATKLSSGTICIGKFISKYYNLSSDVISYGAVNIPKTRKKEKKVVWVGRLEKETGILKALKEMKKYKRKGYKIDFCGDGPLKKECEKVGSVHGYVNPMPFLAKAKVCFPVGYLSALEGMASKCKIKVVWNNKLKEDYWKLTPFWKYIKNEDINKAYEWVEKQSWGKLTEKYVNLWKN